MVTCPAPFNSPLDSALVAPIAPPMHSGFFLAWALCSALFVVTIIPGGFLAVRRYRAMTAAGQGSAKRAQPLGDRYVPPESTALQVPPQCLLPPGPDTGNLTFNLATQYSPRLGAVNGSETLHVLCYYNRSRATRLRSGQTWFGVASLPFPLCRYVVYGPMRLNAEAAKVDATPRDVILIEQLRFAATSGSTGKDPASSLMVSLRGRGEFTLLRRSVGNLR
ncbi:hypothetical protein HPB48_002334 [Haemaphysalis longicornis]|uniref:Uncharacterized protein n=1 Tax=Haemaphysalis longicornis TaxID=44386 RepID=A0A9J6FFN9_HAELO|nr:hypothetical protein HPB48_002334 [Haemaphysalis longicornis]